MGDTVDFTSGVFAAYHGLITGCGFEDLATLRNRGRSGEFIRGYDAGALVARMEITPPDDWAEFYAMAVDAAHDAPK